MSHRRNKLTALGAVAAVAMMVAAADTGASANSTRQSARATVHRRTTAASDTGIGIGPRHPSVATPRKASIQPDAQRATDKTLRRPLPAITNATFKRLNARGPVFIPLPRAVVRQDEAHGVSLTGSPYAISGATSPLVSEATAEATAANLGIWGPATPTGESLVSFGSAAITQSTAPTTVWLISLQPKQPVYPASDGPVGPSGSVQTFGPDTYFVVAVNPATGAFVEASDG
jgi:hypothetical protein